MGSDSKGWKDWNLIRGRRTLVKRFKTKTPTRQEDLLHENCLVGCRSGDLNVRGRRRKKLPVGGKAGDGSEVLV